MKILFVSQTASIHGGVERWLSTLCLGLSEIGVEISLALVDGPQFHRADVYMRFFPELAAFNPIFVSTRSGMPASRVRALRKIILDVKPDVVVPVLVQEVLEAVTLARRQGFRGKLVYPVHENEVWAFNAVAESGDAIDAVVSVNRLMLDAVENFAAWQAERAFHIRGGVALAPPPNLSNIGRTSIVIGYCGKLDQPLKRALDLVGFCQQMDARLPAYTLLIAGTGGEEPALRERLAAQIADGRVRLLGSLPQNALSRDFYQKLDVLLITSTLETGPLVAWEAMMHGVAILTSNYQGQRREGVLRHRETALVYPISQMAAAVEALQNTVNKPGALQLIGSRGRVLAESEFSIEAMIQRWHAAISQVMVMKMRSQEGRLASKPKRRNFAAAAEDGLRSLLNRPVRHGNSHQEWPRYRPGGVSVTEREGFSNRLDELERSLGPVGRGEAKSE